MQRVAHWPRGVRDPEHAWKLYAREPGDPANWPCLVAQRGPRRESKEYDGDERLREVGQPNSTCKAFEQEKKTRGQTYTFDSVKGQRSKGVGPR